VEEEEEEEEVEVEEDKPMVIYLWVGVGLKTLVKAACFCYSSKALAGLKMINQNDDFSKRAIYKYRKTLGSGVLETE
jgi:hypothetical protein